MTGVEAAVSAAIWSDGYNLRTGVEAVCPQPQIF